MRHTQTRTFDRRTFLKAAARAGTSVAAGSLLPLGVFQLGRRALARESTSQPLIHPSELRSVNGILEATITAACGPVRLGDNEFTGMLYNGSYVPPTLRARLGDTLRITFRNDLTDRSRLDHPGYVGPICTGADTPSNLHFHGMSVSPQGNSDNVFVHVHPGETFRYEVRIPAAGRQGPGLFWYHPHAHGFVNDQILGGLSGALVVDGIERLFPILQGLPERFFFIKHAKLGNDTRSYRSTARSIRLSRCARVKCSSGALPISARRSSINSASRACRSMSWRRTATRCRSRAR